MHLLVVLTDDQHVIVELPFVFTVAIQCCHVLQTFEHAVHNLLVCRVNMCPDLHSIRADQLLLDTAHIDWEILDKVSHAFAFLTRQFRLVDHLDLLVLRHVISDHVDLG